MEESLPAFVLHPRDYGGTGEFARDDRIGMMFPLSRETKVSRYHTCRIDDN